MAAITQTTVKDAGVPTDVTRVTMTASDTLTYTQGAQQVLVLYNTTASPVTVTLVGSGATSISPLGYGGSISLTAGKAVTVPASGATVVDLDDLSEWLKGNVTLTGGTGLVAMLYK